MRFLQCLVLVLLPFLTDAQSEENQKKKNTKGTFYFGWGYNKDWFSKSDLHFSDHGTGNYDFTLYDVEAIDNPSLEEVFNSDITIPQFIYRFGYYFNDKNDLGIEIGFDHAKYIMVRSQRVRVKGMINEVYMDKDTLIDPRFLRFEHTNGANFLMASLLKRKMFFQSPNGKHVLNYVLKPGIGVVVPRTDVTIFGVRQDNVFHVAGYIAGLDVAFRYEYGKHFFSETGFKGCYANYMDVITIGEAKANHDFFVLEYLFSIGFAVPL